LALVSLGLCDFGTFSCNIEISLFRGGAGTVVDNWVNTDCSTPKNYQCIFNGEITLVPSIYPLLSAPQELAILHTLEHSARIHDVKFAQKVDGSGEVVFVAAEDRTTTVYGVHPDSSTLLRPTARLVGHGNRYDLDFLDNSLLKLGSVKAIDTMRIALPSTSTRQSTTILSSVSSDGTINIYDLSLVPTCTTETVDITEISPVVTYDSKGSRLTCVALADGEVGHQEQPTPVKGAKRKRETVSEVEEEEEEEEEWLGLS
jgi:protein MAK11